MKASLAVGHSLTVAIVLTLFHGGLAYAECSHSQRSAGTCTEVTTDVGREEVNISRSESTSGSPGSEQTSSTSLGGSGSSQWSPPPIRLEATLGSPECEVRVSGLCRGSAPPKATPAETSTHQPPTPPRHASELRSFRPKTPGLTVEPAGWSLPSLPTNMVARAERHRVSGELLGWPVDVRFTPTAYHWDFGDGSRVSRSQPGQGWAASGRRQFDATPTSHRYLRPGHYRVSLQVDYRVEFRFEGETFRPLNGLVSAFAPSQSLTVLTVSPLLFGR